jgi:hypothetical protein
LITARISTGVNDLSKISLEAKLQRTFLKFFSDESGATTLTEQAGPIGRSQHLFLVALLASASAAVMPFMGTKSREVILLNATHS